MTDQTNNVQSIQSEMLSISAEKHSAIMKLVIGCLNLKILMLHDMVVDGYTFQELSMILQSLMPSKIYHHPGKVNVINSIDDKSISNSSSTTSLNSSVLGCKSVSPFSNNIFEMNTDVFCAAMDVSSVNVLQNNPRNPIVVKRNANIDRMIYEVVTKNNNSRLTSPTGSPNNAGRTARTFDHTVGGHVHVDNHHHHHHHHDASPRENKLRQALMVSHLKELRGFSPPSGSSGSSGEDRFSDEAIARHTVHSAHKSDQQHTECHKQGGTPPTPTTYHGNGSSLLSRLSSSCDAHQLDHARQPVTPSRHSSFFSVVDPTSVHHSSDSCCDESREAKPAIPTAAALRESQLAMYRKMHEFVCRRHQVSRSCDAESVVA